MRVLLLLLALASAARAAEAPPVQETGAYTLGARAVYYIPADGESSWNPGVQARWYFLPRLAAELAGDYQRHLFPDTTVHTAAAQASALGYLLPEGRLRAFGLAGAGYYASRVNAPNYRRNLGRFAFHLGLGGEAWLSGDWSVDLTYRHVFLKDLETRAPDGSLRTYKRGGEQITLGVNRRFGAGERP